MRPFADRVIALVRRIPPGRVATYADIARLAGSPRAWRAVGAVLRRSTDPGVPCHRVIGAGGALGGFGSHPQLKRDLLRAEGHLVELARVRRFAEVRWRQAGPGNGAEGAATARPGARRTAVP